MKKPIFKIFSICCAILASVVFCDIVYTAPTAEFKKLEVDAKVYTYKSECDCSPTVSGYTCSKGQDQTIIFNQNTTAWDTAYIFQHGDGFRESGDFCGWKLNVCENINDKAKNILFIGFKMAGGEPEGKKWSGNYNAQCLFKEAKTAAESIIGVGKFPNKLILASYSQGGIAFGKMFEKNNQPSGIVYSVFLDSCFGNHCEVVANKSTSIRGIMKMYRSTIQPDSKDWQIKNAQQNEAATAFMNNNPPASTSLSAINGKHEDVPANCSFDFLLNNNCNNKTLSGSITGTGSTPGVNVPFVNEIIQLTKPTPKITIPGLNFSDIKVVDEPEGRFLYIPFLGEYIAAAYKFGVVFASIFAIVMIINHGFNWAISGGTPEKINHAKTRITQSIVGLFIAVASYALLYMINPNLVEFKSLRVLFIETKLVTEDLITTEEYQLLLQGLVSTPAGNIPIPSTLVCDNPTAPGSGLIPLKQSTGLKIPPKETAFLNPQAAEALKKAGEIADKEGYLIYVTSACRTLAKQIELASKNPASVKAGTTATAGGSPHGFGLAVDVQLRKDGKVLVPSGGSETQCNVEPTYVKKLSEIMYSAGFYRLGIENWHFELPPKGKYCRVKNMYDPAPCRVGSKKVPCITK